MQFKEIEREGSDQDFCSAVHHLINSQADGEGETLSRYAIAEAVLEMLFAGHDTVTSQMCSILMFLGKNKKCIDKLRKELEVKGLLNISDYNSEITLSVLNRLEYLNMVIKETLRLCPPVGAGYRRVLKTFELEVSIGRYLPVHDVKQQCSGIVFFTTKSSFSQLYRGG